MKSTGDFHHHIAYPQREETRARYVQFVHDGQDQPSITVSRTVCTPNSDHRIVWNLTFKAFGG